jgi:hypothetical protein
LQPLLVFFTNNTRYAFASYSFYTFKIQELLVEKTCLCRQAGTTAATLKAFRVMMKCNYPPLQPLLVFFTNNTRYAFATNSFYIFKTQ